MNVVIRDLQFSYGSKDVLKNINIRADAGKILTVIGPNGSGKTTLLKCIAGLLKPKKGYVELNERKISTYKKEELAKLIGYVPQEISHGGVLTVFETVLLGRCLDLSWRVSDEDLDIVLRILEDFGIQKFASRNINELSGGERQHVFIAQSLVTEPKVLIMDEPISNLDLRHQLEILDLVKNWTKKNNIVAFIAMHDLNMAARFSDELVVLNGGENFAFGEPKSVLTTEMIRLVYGVNAKIYHDGNGKPQIIPIDYSRKSEYTQVEVKKMEKERFEFDWEKQWLERIKSKEKNASMDSVTDYWNKRAEDYADYIRTSDYDHGRKIKEIFEKENILKRDFEVLDIGAGPGSLTIPFAESVKKVTAVEPAREMCKYLMRNSKEKGLENIEVINKRWEDIDDAEFEKKFDIVICSHVIWHFSDIGKQLMRMNNASRRYCCIATSAKSESQSFDGMYQKLGLLTDGVQISDFIYLFNILYYRNILANVAIIDTVMKRSVSSGISMWELFLGRYREPT